MKTQRISAVNLATNAVNQSDRIQNFQADALEIAVVVGGTVHSFANFDNHIINISLRKKEGGSEQILTNVKVSDLLKVSDYQGGFSSKTKANAVGRYVAYVGLGNVIISGDDIMEVNLVLAGHATATYGYTIDAVDVIQGFELIKTFESKTGTGATEYMKNVETIYMTSPATGAVIPMKDQESGAFTILDTLAVDVANSLGRMETFEDIGILWNDRTGLTQDIEATIPNGVRIFVVRQAFPLNRLGNSQEQVSTRAALITKMAVSSPDKVQYLDAAGRL